MGTVGRHLDYIHSEGVLACSYRSIIPLELLAAWDAPFGVEHGVGSFTVLT